MDYKQMIAFMCEKAKGATAFLNLEGGVEGGTVGNTVPEKCSFIADIRFANAAQMEEATKKVYEVAAHSYLEGTTCEVELMSQRIAMEDCERNRELLRRINEISEETGLPTLEGRSAKGGSDAAYTTACAIPTVDNLAAVGGHIHSAEEYCSIPSLVESTKRLAAIILKL